MIPFSEFFDTSIRGRTCSICREKIGPGMVHFKTVHGSFSGSWIICHQCIKNIDRVLEEANTIVEIRRIENGSSN